MHQQINFVAKKIAIKDCSATLLVSLFEKVLAEEGSKYNTTIVDNFLNLANEIASRRQGLLKTFFELQFLYFYLCDATKECGRKISEFLKQSIEFSDDASCFSERNIILSCYPYRIHKRAEFLADFDYSSGEFKLSARPPASFKFYVHLYAKSWDWYVFQKCEDLDPEKQCKYLVCNKIDEAIVKQIKIIYEIDYNVGEEPEYTDLEFCLALNHSSCSDVLILPEPGNVFLLMIFALKNAFPSLVDNTIGNTTILGYIIRSLILSIPPEIINKIRESEKKLNSVAFKNSVENNFSNLISNTKGLCENFKIKYKIKVYGNDVVIYFYRNNNRTHEEISDFVFSVCNAIECSTEERSVFKWRIDEFNGGIVLTIPHQKTSNFLKNWPKPSKWISDVPIIPYEVFKCFLTGVERYNPRFWFCLEKSEKNNSRSLVKFAVENDEHVVKEESFVEITAWLRRAKVPDDVIVKLWCYNPKFISIDVLSVIDYIFKLDETLKICKELFLENPLFRRSIIEYLQKKEFTNKAIFKMVCSENIEKIIQEMLKQYNANFVGLKEEDSYVIRFFMRYRLDVAFRILSSLLKVIESVPIQITPRDENIFSRFLISSNSTTTTKSNNAHSSIVKLMCETLRLCFESDKINHKELYKTVKANKFLEKHSEIEDLIKKYEYRQLLLQDRNAKPLIRK